LAKDESKWVRFILNLNPIVKDEKQKDEEMERS